MADSSEREQSGRDTEEPRAERILVVVSEPISAEDLRAALGDVVDDAEVLVISPAMTKSPLRFWLSDVDKEITRAEAIQEETVEALRRQDVEAQGDTGESDPLLAVQDALATFKPARVVVFAHEPEGERYREYDLARQLEERLSIPVLRRALGSRQQ